MVNHSALDATFGALADPVRRAVLVQLRQGPAPVSALASHHAISLPAFLKHLRVLEGAGLVETRKTGRVRYCRPVPSAFGAAERWIQEHRVFWQNQLAQLDRYLREQEHDPWPVPSPPPATASKSGASSRPRRRASTRRGRTR